MRGSRVFAIILVVALLMAVGLAAALKHQQLQRRERARQAQQRQ